MKTVIEMAHEAGFQVNQGALLRIYLEHFAELVRADAIADEREACATVCDGLRVEYEEGKNMAVVCAAAIRARSNT